MNNKTPNNILLAGPWVGEFGWELFCWQGYVRKLSKNYDKTIILSRSGHEFLYEDFADEFYSFDSATSKANMWLGEINEMSLNLLTRNIIYNHHIKPFNIGFGINGNTTIIIDSAFNQQDFIKYQANTIDKEFDILVHARNKVVGSNRNWDFNKWQSLIDLLKKEFKIGVIGTDEAFHLKGTEDLRNISITDLVSVMNRTELVIGQSSGPLHLASLCGTPHFVWSDITNKERYEKYWNPFNTEVIFYSKEGWNPNVNTLYDEIVKSW